MDEIEKLSERYQQLQNDFIKDTDINDKMLDSISVSIPKKMSKYIFFYHDCLNYLATLKEEKDALYYQIMTEYRMGDNQLSKFNWSSTELKQIIESSSNMRALNYQNGRVESMLKSVEKMMSEVKNISFSINNSLTYKKIMNGMI